MNDAQLLRYSRHILLPEIGIEGQQQINEAHALIIGAGGLGSPVSMYLASSGIGTITLCDNDTVDLTNLQRQILHRTSSVGTSKVSSALANLSDMNPEIKIHPVNERIGDLRLTELVAEATVVIDCSDNFATRYALNRACFQLKTPLVSGAAIGFSGQVSVFDFRHNDCPCYNCLYPEHTESEETRCATMGVFAPLVGIIGSLQASEALKLVAGGLPSLIGKLFILDARNMETRTIKLSQDPGCAICGS
jgi:molybdopterin/thiamine biosynthesis adenylyltransferase